jgi:transcriptional regulator with XRE-family HTH domain
MPTSRPTRTWIVRSPADLGRAVAGIRKLTGRSQEDLSAEVGVHRPYLSRIESGDVPMVVERVLRMLRRMGATVTITLPGDDGEES